MRKPRVTERPNGDDPPPNKTDTQKQDIKYKTITEGLATIQVPVERSGSKKEAVNSQSVFYNPIQQFNRDLSVLMIDTFAGAFIPVRREHIERTRPKRRKKVIGKRKRDDPEEETDELPQEAQRTDESGFTGISQAAHQPDITKQGGAGLPHGEKLESRGELHSPVRFTILDALSATGLRAIRYAKEITQVTSVTANDMSPTATDAIRSNVERNGLEEKVNINTSNASALMYSVPFGDNHFKYDVIDLDPYGTAAPLFDAAVQALSDGGLLCATCTDSAVFASTGYPEKTFSLYGGVPVKGIHSHEGGLRLILQAIAASAARYGLAIEPMLSLSIDYYIRVFVRVWRSPAQVKFLAGKTMLVYSCDYGCGAWSTQHLIKNRAFQTKKGDTLHKHSVAQGPSAPEHCQHCKFRTHIAGPMWAGPLHSPSFIQKVLKRLPDLSRETYGTIDRIEGMLTTALEEDLDQQSTAEATPQALCNEDTQKPAQAETVEVPMGSENANLRASSTFASYKAVDSAAIDPYPFFFMPNILAGILRCVTPTENAIRGALKHLGFRVTRSHTRPGSIKTDAPWAVIWEVMRQWVKQKAPIKEGALTDGNAGYRILHNEALTKVQLKTLVERAKGDNANIKERVESNDDVTPAAMGVDDEQQHIEVIFDEALGAADKDTTRSLHRHHRSKGLLRYQINPRPNWGPMTRAKADN